MFFDRSDEFKFRLQSSEPRCSTRPTRRVAARSGTTFAATRAPRRSDRSEVRWPAPWVARSPLVVRGCYLRLRHCRSRQPKQK